jgi:hypothetical protein
LAPEQPGHHYLALLADASEDYDASDGHFGAALQLLERAHAPVMMAISEVAWARSLERRGETARVRELVELARGRAVRAGATQVEREADEILERVK